VEHSFHICSNLNGAQSIAIFNKKVSRRLHHLENMGVFFKNLKVENQCFYYSTGHAKSSKHSFYILSSPNDYREINFKISRRIYHFTKH
jgi:hypothetical protein